MTQKQSRTYFSIVGLLVALVAIGFLCMSAVQHRVTSHLDVLEINFDRTIDQAGFINKAHVIRLLKNTFGDDLSDRVIDETDLALIEEIMQADTFISSANAYLSGSDQLVIDIKERMPKYRVMPDGEDSYYVDNDYKELPLHHRFVKRVPVITVDRNYGTLKEDDKIQVMELIDQVEGDPFLHALVEQVHMDSHGDVFIIPKIGKEKLKIGELVDIPDKLYKIKQFYKKGITTKGWNTYDELDLSFKDQVIGTIKE